MMQKCWSLKILLHVLSLKLAAESTSVADKGTSLQTHAADAANVGPPSVWLPI